MLTPFQISQANGATPGGGGTSPTQAMTPDQAKAWIQPTPVAKTAAEQEPSLAEHASFLGQRIAGDVQGAGDTLHNAITGQGEFEGKNPIERGVRGFEAAAGAVPKIASEFLPLPARENLAKAGDVAGGAINKAGEGYANIVDWLGQKLGISGATDFVKNYPEATKVIESGLRTTGALGSISTDILGAEGAKAVGGGAVDAIKGIAKEGAGGPVVPNVEPGIAMPKDSAPSGAAPDVVDKVQNALNLKNPFGTGKTPEEVFATPEKDVGKLSSSERAAYYKNQADTVSAAHDAELEKINQVHEASIKDIKQKADAAQAKIDADLQVKSDASIKETQALKKQIDETSVAEAGSLKKPAIEVYRKNSKQFGKLFDEEFTPDKQKIPLKQADLIAKLDNEFANEPDMNPKGRLGLDEKGKDITAKDFYDRVRGLKMSSAGSKGTSTFTAGDLAINRTRGILTETLKENGVDLSKANKFWSEWKPLQREINSKVKPFDPGYKTGTMANVLKNSASEVGDAKNAKFISDFEQQLGRPLPKGTKAAMEKLSAAQKQMIADEVAAQEAKDAAVAEKESAIENQKTKTGAAKDKLSAQKEAAQKDIYNRKFSADQDADRIAKNRRNLLWALGAAGVGTGAIKLSL